MILRLPPLRGLSVKAILPVLRESVREQNEKIAFQIYLTDALKVIGENTAKYSGGSYLKVRFEDIVHPRPEETRTPEEVKNQITQKLARLGGENE